MRTVIISDEQIETLHSVSERIYNSKNYTLRWSIQNIMLGLLGEAAYGIVNNMQVNTDSWSDRGDGGVDFPDGADVKTISYTGNNPQLKLNKLPDDNCKAEKFILAVCDIKHKPNEVHLIGEITAKNFKNKATLRRYGSNLCYAVDVTDLDTTY